MLLPRQLIGVTIQPVDAQAVAPDGTVPFTATGTYDQAPSTQPDLPVTWISSDTIIATVDNNGIATCLTVGGGPVTITGLTNGKGGTVKGTGALTCQMSTNPIAKLNPSSLGFICEVRGAGAPVCGCRWEASGNKATLTNFGQLPLTITSIDAGSDGPTQTNTCVGSTLDAEESCEITMLSTPKPNATGSPHYNVKISDNALDSPQTLTILGVVQCVP